MNRRFLIPEPSNPARGSWELMDGSGQATALGFNSSGSLLAVGGQAGRIAVWDVTTLRTVIKVLDPSLMDLDEDNLENALDADELKAVQMVKFATYCCWSCDNRLLVVACMEKHKQGRLCIWDVQNEVIIKTIR